MYHCLFLSLSEAPAGDARGGATADTQPVGCDRECE